MGKNRITEEAQAFLLHRLNNNRNNPTGVYFISHTEQIPILFGKK